jgi:hypothetical protein
VSHGVEKFPLYSAKNIELGRVIRFGFVKNGFPPEKEKHLLGKGHDGNIAENSTTGDQVTEWIYGVTVAQGSAVDLFNPFTGESWTSSGLLYSSSINQNLSGPRSAPLTHQIKVSWNCCPNQGVASNPATNYLDVQINGVEVRK